MAVKTGRGRVGVIGKLGRVPWGESIGWARGGLAG